MATGFIDVLDLNRALVCVIPVRELRYWLERHPGYQFREHVPTAGEIPDATDTSVDVAGRAPSAPAELLRTADQLVVAVLADAGAPAPRCAALIARYLELRETS